MLTHRAGIIDQLIGLRSTEYLVNETSYLPWSTATTNLAHISTMFDRSVGYGFFQVRANSSRLEHILPG